MLIIPPPTPTLPFLSSPSPPTFPSHYFPSPLHVTCVLKIFISFPHQYSFPSSLDYTNTHNETHKSRDLTLKSIFLLRTYDVCFSGLGYFTRCNISSSIHLPENSISLSTWIIPLYIDSSFTIHSLANGHLGSFHALTIMNRVSMNMCWACASVVGNRVLWVHDQE